MIRNITNDDISHLEILSDLTINGLGNILFPKSFCFINDDTSSITSFIIIGSNTIQDYYGNNIPDREGFLQVYRTNFENDCFEIMYVFGATEEITLLFQSVKHTVNYGDFFWCRRYSDLAETLGLVEIDNGIMALQYTE